MRTNGRLSRRSLLGWGGVVGGGVLLAACGAQPGAMTETEAEAEAPKAEMAEKAAEPQLIVHTDWWGPGNAPTLDEYFTGIKADFEELNPGKIIEYVFVSGTIGVQNHVTTMVAANQQVDSVAGFGSIHT